MYLKFVGHNGSNFWRGAALGIRESSANLELHKQAQRERERERERQGDKDRQTDRQSIVHKVCHPGYKKTRAHRNKCF